jgi:hypothetical protein
MGICGVASLLLTAPLRVTTETRKLGSIRVPSDDAMAGKR